jgi:hypothetical protein
MLVLGALLLCVALLALAGLTVVFRSPNPPRWTAWSGELITLAIVSGFALGLACLIGGLSNAFEQGLGLVDLGLLAAVIAGTFVIWHRLGLRARWRSMATAPSAPSRGPRAAPRPTARVAPADAKPSAPEPSPSKPRPRAA